MWMRTLLLAAAIPLAARAEARWIWIEGEPDAPVNRLTYFRKVVDLAAIPENGDLLFAADSNARLSINGQPVRRKVTRYHEDKITADVVDAAPYLRTGRNVVVVLHHNWGPVTTFQRSANRHAGLYVKGSWIESGETWRAIMAPEFAPHDRQIRGVDGGRAFRIRFPMIVDGRKALPDSMHTAGFDDASWRRAVEVSNGPWPSAPNPVEIPGQREYAVYAPGILAAGALHPSQPLSDDPLSIAVGIRTARYSPEAAALAAAKAFFHRQPVKIQGLAGESRYVTFDFQQPVHGFPFLDLESASQGVTIDLGYGEIAYSQRTGEAQVRPDGGIDSEAVVGIGYADRYVTRSGAQRFEFPDERTARWLTLHFHFASAGEVVVRETGIVRSQYPILPVGSFFCGDERVEQIVKLCQIHAVVTMSDGYVDTPGREDGQWIEDARVRAIIGSRWYGDERLRRVVLRLHAESARGDGGFHAFPPSNYPAYPSSYDWAVQWTAMLYDDYFWTGRADLIERYWKPLREFWANLLSKVDANGIWRTRRVLADIRVGIHPTNDRESSGIVTPFMIERLRWSAEMAKAAGHAPEAEEWMVVADRMARAFRQFHILPASGNVPPLAGDRLNPENPATERGLSQAGQVNAVLAGLLSRESLDYAFGPPDGRPPAGMARWNNPTFAYRALRALSDHGMTDRAVAHLIERYAPYLPGHPRNPVPAELQGPQGGPLPEYWVSREDLGLKPGDKNPAQPLDETGSHGWSAVPLLWMHESLLGVRILDPGGSRLRIAPDAGGLPFVAGQTRTPKGNVWVEWQPSKQRLELEIPAGVTAEMPLASLRVESAPPQGAKKGKAGYLLSRPGKYVFGAK